MTGSDMTDEQLDKLLAFIEERLAEDEQVARYVVDNGYAKYSAEWTEPRNGAVNPGDYEEEIVTFDSATSHHIAHFDPARALRQCDALRDAVTEVQRIVERSQDPDSRMWAGAALRRMVLIWIDVDELDRLWTEWTH